MIKCVVTGDNHFGKSYGGRFESKKNILIEKRFESLENLVNKANDIDADLFFVTGDLFDAELDVPRDVVKRAVEILAKFKKDVYIIPGNHDFYGEHVEVWQYFRQCNHFSNVVLLSSPEPRTLTDVGKDKDTVVLYPAICTAKNSDTNALGWIKKQSIQKNGVINIGLAHGAVQGMSCDNELRYYYMGIEELERIDVDAWFVGHAHVQRPADLTENEEVRTDKIYNPGTHQQTDSGNNTEGCGFVISISKEDRAATIKAAKLPCGNIHYYKKQIDIPSATENALRDGLVAEIKDYDKDSTILELSFKGIVTDEEYAKREEICRKVTDGFFFVDEFDFSYLYEEVTPAKIDEKFRKGSFASDFLLAINDTDERNTAFVHLMDIASGRLAYIGDVVQTAKGKLTYRKRGIDKN